MNTKPFLLRFGLAVGLSAALLVGCKKNDDPAPGTLLPSKGIVGNTVRDSVYYIATELFLWRDKLPAPADFKPTSYATPEELMAKVRTYSPENSAGTGNVDRWSFATPVSEWNKVLTGSSAGFGFSRGYVADNDLRVVFAYPNSPIGQAGVRRGWRIVKVDGIEASKANETAIANAISGKSSATYEFLTNAGETKTLALTKADYKSNSVLQRSIIEVDGKKVGYLMYNSFIVSTARQELDEAFAYFKANNVTELVADLRYNGGGYVNISERFANYVVPQSVAGKLMYTDQHNDKYKAWNRVKNFDGTLPADNLNLKRIVFIAARGSASASELLINVLRPHMDVKIIGDDTYGKPVGYYQIPVMGYISSPVAVKQTNAAGYGDYYEGLKADRYQIDDYTRDFGDPNEARLKDALSYLRTGTIPARQAARRETLDAQVHRDEAETFVGAIQELPKALRR
ncbi:MAG: hypothetical protein LH606_04890 [Cytophagaceae bacterium]|nr:hypothetical protein [Cytophagaceae bacterium]